MFTKLSSKIKDTGLYLSTWLACLRRREGITTVEVLLILAVAGIILGSTYFAMQSSLNTWWNDRIVKQFLTK